MGQCKKYNSADVPSYIMKMLVFVVLLVPMHMHVVA